MGAVATYGAESGRRLSPDEVTRDAAGRFWSKVDRRSDCWLWIPKAWSSGYGYFWLNGKAVRAHRVAYVLGHDEAIPAGKLICHSCDNRICMRPDHLYIGTAANNMADMLERGEPFDIGSVAGIERARGERVASSVLTAETVEHLRRECRKGEMNCAEVAAAFNVSHTLVRQIGLGRAWAHVPGALTTEEWRAAFPRSTLA